MLIKFYDSPGNKADIIGSSLIWPTPTYNENLAL